MPARPTRRPVTPEDDPFLFELYASTRAQELATWGWSAAQQEAFLRMQWKAQQRGYLARYPPEGHHILELEGQPVGRTWVVHEEHALRLVDVALLPAWRGKGLGSGWIRELQAEAAEVGKPLRLHVTRDNPALRLYLRLGFSHPGGVKEERDSPYVELVWSAPPREG